MHIKQTVELSNNSTAFALGFLHLGEKDGAIIPGQANVQLARILEQHAGWFSLVLTQKAISDALHDPQALPDGTPVLQMHRHDPSVPVRTLPALMCALERFPEVPERIVLLAHPRHTLRALMDLKALYDGELLALCPGQVIYPADHWLYPLRWACKNLLAWPADFLLTLCIKYPAFAPLWWLLKQLGIRADCPAKVRLPKIDKSRREQ